jgi:excisionase family DNA binding protein
VAAFAHHKGYASLPPLQWTTVAAVAAHVGVSLGTVRTWLHRGRLRGVQIQTRHYTDERSRGGTRGVWRIYEADLRQFLRTLRGSEVPLPDSIWRTR